MKFKAIIFDMDGTIIDSAYRWQEATLHILKTKCNFSHEQAISAIQQFEGASTYDSCAYIKMAYKPKESIQELIKAKDEYVFKHMDNLVQFIDGFQS